MKEIIAQAISKIKRQIKESFDIFSEGNWEVNYVALTNEIRREMFVRILGEVDEEFFRSESRRSQYLSKDKVSRTLVTTFGEISFQRRKYKCRETNKSFYFIDKVLELIPYARVSSTGTAFVLGLVIHDKLSYQKAAEKLNLSKSFVYTTLQKIDLTAIQVKLDKPIACEHLHVIADEDHVAVQDKNRQKVEGSNNRHMLRQITLYTGLKKVNKGRNQLENRVVFSQHEGESVEGFCDRVHQFIARYYTVSGDIYVYGDGAPWIKTLANIVGTTDFILDRFHLMQAVTRICGGKKNTELRAELAEFVRKDNKKAFDQKIAELYPEGMSDFKTKQVAYIKNNWSFYRNNFQLPGALVCSAEAINSHYFAARLSSRPMGFSVANIHKLGSLLSLAASSVDIKVFFQENITKILAKEKPSDKQAKRQPQTGVSLPLLGYKNKQTREVFKGLMYNGLIV